MPFSSEFATIVVETNRKIDTTLSKTFGFSSTDFCILQQLYVGEGEIRLSDLQKLFLLKRNSIATAVMRLEERGLVTKRPMRDDLRSFRLVLTEEGTKNAEIASSEIRRVLVKASWHKNPEDPRIDDCMKMHADNFFDKRLNTHLKSKDLIQDYYILPGWILGLKELQKDWTETVKNRFGLSFGEYRTLAFLVEQDESLRSKAIAAHLFFDQSMVSVIVKRLAKYKYVMSRIDKADKRCSEIEVTEEGRRMQQDAFSALSAVTAEHFTGMSSQDKDMLNQWHLEMCEMLYE